MGHPSAANVSALFYERSPGHSYLYDLYHDAVPSRLVTPRHEPWNQSPKGLELSALELGEVLAEAKGLGVPLVLMTLDSFLHERFRPMLIEASRHQPIVALLHQPRNLPVGEAGEFDLGDVRICVLAPEVAAQVQHRLGVSIEVLPHHPSIYAVPPRPHSRRPRDRVVVSMLGEFRGGKGLDLVLEAIGLLGPQLAHRLHFQFGGRADAATHDRVAEAVERAGTTADLWLREGVRPDYDVLSAIEFADLARDTDIGLLLYQEDQRGVMSGVLPNFVAAGAAVVATQDSIVGSIVETNRLGVAIEEGPMELRDALASLAEPAVRTGCTQSPQYEAYRRFTSPDNVARTLRSILGLAA